MADSPISPTTNSPGSASSPTSSNHIFSRFRLTNPFASSATATTDGNSRRKSSTALPGATSPDSPTFKMSSTNGGASTAGNKGGNGSRLTWRKDSVPVNPITPPATASSNNASTTNLPLMTEDISNSATAGAEGGAGGSGGFVRTVKRTASAGSLGKMLGDRFGGNKGQSTWQKARKRFSAGSSADDGSRDEDASRPASSASGRLSRSNAMHGRGRKSSWRGSWGSSAASASTADKNNNNNNNSHILFSNTDVTDGAVANPDAGGPHKGFRRRKTSTTLHGLVGGKGRGLGLGSSALAMTPTAGAEEDRQQRPNTRDGVFTNSIAADPGGTTAIALNDNDGGTPTRKKSSSVSNAADSLARRIKIHRLKRSSSLDAKLFLGGSNGESNNNNGSSSRSNANNGSSTGGRPRSKSESASALLATPAKLIKYRPFLAMASGGSKGSSNNHSTSIANNAHPNASTTALRRPSRTPSSESGFNLSVSGIETHGLLSSIGSGGGGIEPSSTSAGATSPGLSGPTLLLPDTDSDEHHQADAAAATTTTTMAASSSASSSRSRSSWSRLSLRMKRSRSNASGVADSAAGSRAPTLPELPPSENYLLGEFSIPEFEHVEGADGEIEWVEKGTGRVVQTIGKQTGTTMTEKQKGMVRRQDADAIRRVVENRRKIVVASDRADEEEGRPSRSAAADDGEQAKRTEIWVEEVKREQAADPAEAKAGAELSKDVTSEAVAKDVESGACVREVDGGPSSSGGDGVPILHCPSPRSLTPKPTPAQLAAAHEITARGRAMLVEPGKKHDRIIPSQGSSVYSTQDASPLTPPTSSGTPIPQANDYAKDIETEIVDDRWVDYGPLNEVRLL